MASLSRYFDHNATTPASEAARAARELAEAEHWHNPSGLYPQAAQAKTLLEDARERLADHLGIEDPERVVFTSGATEANNAVVRHFATAGRGALAISAVEHPCVEAAARALLPAERVRTLPVDPASGVLDLGEAERILRSGGVGAVSVMAANNESGALQPWRELSALCREAGIAFHTDAAQWLGKGPAGAIGEALGDEGWLSGSGHKFGGGLGAGFVLVPAAPETEPAFLLGGPQEGGRRAGTENLPAVAAMVAALEEKDDASLAAAAPERAAARDAFEAGLVERLGARILGRGGHRLWNTSFFVLPEGKNLKWIARLGRRGFCLSTGSACSAGRGAPSRVMAAMGLDYDDMGRAMRASGGWGTSGEDWQALLDALCEVRDELRSP